MGFIYAAMYPDEVDSLICLDIASPTIQDLNETVDRAGDWVDKFYTYETLSLDSVMCYNYKEIIDLIVHDYGGSVTRDSAEVLMKRGTVPAAKPGCHYFSCDPRVKV